LSRLWNKDGLSERGKSSIWAFKSILSDLRLVVEEVIDGSIIVIALLDPGEEGDIVLSCTHNVLDLMSVEPHIMLHLGWIGSESSCHKRLNSVFIVDLPKRDCLRNAVGESDNVVGVGRDVEVDDSILMRVEVSPLRSSPNRVPNHKH
jgi:hypothetical protein